MQINFRVAGQDVAVRETLLDRAIRYAFPVWGETRMRARMRLALAGGYKGGSRSKRSLSGWSTLGGSADSDLLPDLPTLRERSRDLVRNAPLATGALATVTTNVIGTGLMPKADPKRELLGWTEEQTAAWKRKTEYEFALWAESPDCDVTRTQDFYGLQDLAFRSTLENGDTLALLPMVERRGRAYSLAVQLIEADRVCNKDGKADTQKLAGGVELDDFGAPVRYHFLKRHPGAHTLDAVAKEWMTVDAFGAKTGRRAVLHLYERLRIGQTRGAPYFAPVIEAFKQLDRYSEAEVDAAVVSAFFAVFVKSESAAGLSPLESATQGVPPASGTSDAQDTSWDGKLTPGLVAQLRPGEDIISTNPGRPNANFDPFWQSYLQQIGAALQLPHEVLAKKYMASYSAARAALLDAWKFFRVRRAWMASAFCQPIYETWLAEAVARNRIDAPGFFDDPLLRYAYSCAKWHGDGPGAIDPSKEAEAAKTRMEMHLTTLDEEIAAYNGGDAAGTLEQAGREKKMRDMHGLMAPSAMAPAAAPAPAKGNATDRGDNDTEQPEG
jgi:lambda family phage portal protein